MKITEKICLSAFTALVFCSCSSHNTTKLLNDPKSKPEIMNAICADPALMTEMTEHIAKSDVAQQSLIASKDLMRIMHTEKHLGIMMHNDSSMANILSVNLVSMAAQDSSLRREMTDAIMQNGKMRSTLEKMTHESGKGGKEKKHKGSHKKSKNK